MVIVLVFCINCAPSAAVHKNIKTNTENIIYVNTNTGNDSWNGLSPYYDGDGVNGPKKTIKNATATVDTNGKIKIANGYYSGAGNTGIIVSRNMSFIGQSQKGTIISGSNTSRIFEVTNGSTVSFFSLTFTQGSGGQTRGGAIRISADGDASRPSTWIKPNVYFESCTFKNNNGFNGAAIGNYGDLTLKSCNFINNTGNNGAAVFSGTRFANYKIYAKISDCNFVNNILTGTMNGGALYNNDFSDVTVTRSLFTGNVGNNGGAINNNAVGNMTVTQCFFQNNTGNWGADIVFYGHKYNQAHNIANFNKFLSNGPHGSIHVGDDDPTDLRWNWWGTNLDPYKTKFSPYNTGKITVGLLNEQEMMIYDAWIVLSVHTNSTSVHNGKTASITADLNHLSNGDLISQQLPDGQITLNLPWGSFNKNTINHIITLDSVDGSVFATFFANEGAVNPSYNPVQVSAIADDYTTDLRESVSITIDKSCDVYLDIKSDKVNPKVNKTVKLTYKLGNDGPDAAENFTVTIPLPKGFKISMITGDGLWKYNPITNTITWKHTTLSQTSQYLNITGEFKTPGTYQFNANITTDTYNLNTKGITPLTLKVLEEPTPVNPTNNTTNKINMNDTGVPLLALVLAVLLILGGIIVSRRK